MKEKLKYFVEKIKKIFKSKVIWFNTVLAALIPVLPDLIQEAISALPEIQPYVPTDTYKVLMFIATIGNLYLRFHTKVAIAHK